MTARLKVSADDQEGVLQRVIFEFSRRNIRIERLSFSAESGIELEVVTDRDAEAARLVKSVRRIWGVREAELELRPAMQQDAKIPATEGSLNPHELLG
ncbi:MAG: hypothetical protein KIY12_04465 [Thermoplasmata archaeon]|uniref:Uncharacterized protein n=1 Tax=Candidatus Sysuiplasma superficiale TaxID=2823368 RepID=A0A8J7YU25_9ARCH|nr:hypothetical protein [Candidatus Sysuiplasma superficiale]MBX8643960.1 hypothetical protein [Candidatus Sysuiplasma superficiale]MCL4346289.1 hypothetical protein [Candidatus Thermoplasmatota archaeon]